MKACALALLCLGVSFGQTGSFEIKLPSGIRSETVAIRYALIEPFGGFGTWVEFQPNRRSYVLDTRHAGSPATRVKAIIYAAGCAFETVDAPLDAGAPVEHPFTCRPIPSLMLTGKVPDTGLPWETLDIHVNYVAGWAQDFFGFRDGLVTTIPVAHTFPEADGRFRVSVPDFSKEPHAGQSLRFWLRDKATGNLRAELVPVTGKGEAGTLRVAAEYPAELLFTLCNVNGLSATSPVSPFGAKTVSAARNHRH